MSESFQLSEQGIVLSTELNNYIDDRIKTTIIKYLDEIRYKRKKKIREIYKINQEIISQFPNEWCSENIHPYSLDDKDLDELDEIFQNKKWTLEYLKLVYKKNELIDKCKEYNIIIDINNDTEFKKYNTESAKIDAINTTKQIIDILELKIKNAEEIDDLPNQMPKSVCLIM